MGSEISGEHERGALSEVKRRRALAAATFKSLLTTLWKRREVSVEIKMRIFNACVLSRLLHGAETWVVYAGDLASLEAFQNNCLRKILRLSWMERVTRGGGAETVLWTADYRGDSQAKADEVVRPCAENGPGETAKGHVLGDAGR